jgi:CheY-like chemotaxis protein
MRTDHVLLVDDEGDFLDLATECLESVGGWRVTIARSGEEAVTKAIAEPPDVILCDANMPGWDGPETIRRLLEEPTTSDVPVILLTGMALSADNPRVAQIGHIAGVLLKPFDLMQLSDQVRDLVALDAGDPAPAPGEGRVAIAGSIN